MAEEPHDGDEPFRRVVLVPLDCVPVVHRELVVEVVVTLADGDESGDKVIFWSVFVVKRAVAEPVGERVDAERRLRGETEESTNCLSGRENDERRLTWWTKVSLAAPAKKKPPLQSPHPSPATSVGNRKPIPMIRYRYH